MTVRSWQDLTTNDFQELDFERTVALLPLGAIEQHGPHLPLSTDATIAAQMCRRAAALASETPVLLLPVQSVGKSTEHAQFEGTLTHTAETLLRAWMEVGDSVARAGVRKLVFFNGHGGQPQIMEICCRELRIRHDMLCVGAGGGSFGAPPSSDVPADERRFGIHAGTVETSIMLHLAPEQVRMHLAEDFSGLLAEVEASYDTLRIVGGTYVGWQAQDLHPTGCSGDARKATAAIGKLYVEHIAAGLAQLLADVSRYPLSNIRNRPT